MRTLFIICLFVFCQNFLLSICHAVNGVWADNADAIDCLQSIIKKTQSCENQRIQYSTAASQHKSGHGLGSEFNLFLIFDLLGAVRSGKRLVLTSGVEYAWEFDCPEKEKWKCYLNPPCKDSFDADRSSSPSNKENSSVIDLRPSRVVNCLGSNPDDWKQLYKYTRDNFEGAKTKCDHLTPTAATSIAAQHLFHPNKNLSTFIDHFNKGFLFPHGEKFHSLHWRLTDKQSEMGKKTFDWINNATNMAKFMLPHFSADVKQLYVAADNCSLVQQLVKEPKMVAADIKIVSHCLPATIHHDHALQYADVLGAPVRGALRHSQRFFADVMMLVKGQRFIGFQGSNVARLAHRLRFPRIYDTAWFCRCWEAQNNCQDYDHLIK